MRYQRDEGAKRKAYVFKQYLDIYWDQLSQRSERPVRWKVIRSLTEADVAVLFEADQYRVPTICEWLMCLAVDPEFQEDRLADYQERFNGLWVPKFGRRAAIVVYVWHVLRQSRLIDWFVRTFG